MYEINGHRPSASYSIEKLMWIKEHEPDIYQNTYKMLLAKDYIICRLTGKFVTDYSEASGTDAFDLKGMEWSEEVLSAAEIPADKMPELHASTDVIGNLTAHAAEELGLAVNTKVVCGGGDGPCSALAGLNLTAKAETLTGKCGKNVTYSLDTSTGELVISGTGNMTNYSNPIYIPWYSKGSSIKTVTISSGVTSIGDRAFLDCDNLTSVTIPNSVTSIGDGAFSWCENLTSVTIPNSVTSIGDSAFEGCSSLTSVTIPNSVTSIGVCAFSECYITSVTIGNGVTSIGDGAFQYCTSLVSVTIPNSVTSIGSCAFYSCDNLTSITIPNSVTSIGDGAFEDCNNLASITVNSNNNNYSSQDGVLFNKNKTTLIQYPIGNTRTSYTIPNSVTSIGDSAFNFCYKLTSVTIPNSVTSIGDFAFEDCSSLTSVTIPNSVTSIGRYAFHRCDNLTSVTIPNSVTSIGDHAFGYNFADERVKGFTIYGTLGTEAERYANDNGFTFMDVASKPSEPSTEPTTQPTTQPTPQPSVPATQPEQTTQAQSKPAQKSKSTKIKKVKGSKKAIAVQWVKTKGVKGYQVQVATDKKFKKNKKTVTIKKQKTTKTTVKKLKAKKKYYVRVRTYKIVNGKKVYSSWSKVKSVKTK